MRRVIKLVGYASGFYFVIPKITSAIVEPNIGQAFLWYAIFIMVVEGTIALFGYLIPDPPVIRLRKPNEDNMQKVENH